MIEQDLLTADERWATSTVRQAMQGVTPDADAIFAGALEHGAQRRHRRRTVSLAAAAALLAAVGTLGSVANHGGARVAEPAAPPTSAPAHLDGRTAALYLARLSGRTPTDYGGDQQDGVSAQLSFDGHRSGLSLDPQVTTGPTEVAAWDVSVRLDPASAAEVTDVHEDGIFACSGRWLDHCETSVPAAGTALTTGSALTANGCCAIRGDRVNVVAYQRKDRVLVWAEGRPDMFSLAELTAIAESPVWDLQATPSAADAEEADAVLPY